MQFNLLEFKYTRFTKFPSTICASPDCGAALLEDGRRQVMMMVWVLWLRDDNSKTQRDSDGAAGCLASWYMTIASRRVASWTTWENVSLIGFPPHFQHKRFNHLRTKHIAMSSVHCPVHYDQTKNIGAAIVCTPWLVLIYDCPLLFIVCLMLVRFVLRKIQAVVLMN